MNIVVLRDYLSKNPLLQIVYTVWRIDPVDGGNCVWVSQIDIYRAYPNPIFYPDMYDDEDPSTHAYGYSHIGRRVNLDCDFDKDYITISRIMNDIYSIDSKWNAVQAFDPNELEGIESTNVKIYEITWEQYPRGRDSGSEWSDPENDIHTYSKWEARFLSGFDTGEWISEKGHGWGFLAVAEVAEKLLRHKETGYLPIFTKEDRETICGFEAYGHVFKGRPSKQCITGECISGTYHDDYHQDRNVSMEKGDSFEILNTYHRFGELRQINKSLYLNGKLVVSDLNMFLADQFGFGVYDIGTRLATSFPILPHSDQFAQYLSLLFKTKITEIHNAFSMDISYHNEVDLNNKEAVFKFRIIDTNNKGYTFVANATEQLRPGKILWEHCIESEVKPKFVNVLGLWLYNPTGVFEPWGSNELWRIVPYNFNNSLHAYEASCTT